MSDFTTILLLAGAGVLFFSLFYTWSLGKSMKKASGNIDSKIPAPVQGHAYLRNPIFLTYLIAMILVLIFIAYFAVSTLR